MEQLFLDLFSLIGDKGSDMILEDCLHLLRGSDNGSHVCFKGFFGLLIDPWPAIVGTKAAQLPCNAWMSQPYLGTETACI